ncbi:SsgA family sporulation/cell division regulator [Streptomyces sp. A012304]|uniref:SsgA family sporulation/cell division regulator n=1 Tax=Streptomyces sp. A012304 TaxID=375446 RepID=UPI002231C02C|nr:SsgA family sporulation/cell division regulator [Streptomyces sp. A012304]GKQ34105.1 sporulation-specific cell division protein SsgB [Streptomyces sp. A012304]
MRIPLSYDADASSIVFPTEVKISVAGAPWVPLPAELRYDMADPYAVRLCMGAPLVPSIDWVFARSLLMEGVRRPSGIGDVVVIPRHRCDPDSVRILLRTRTGAALLAARAVVVMDFLRRSEALVPPGTEHHHVDVDRLIDRLTAGRE